MDSEEVILRIKADNSEALQNIMEQRKAVDELKAANARLKAENKELAKSMDELTKQGKAETDEYKRQQKQLDSNTTAINVNSEAMKAANREIADSSRHIQNNIKAAKEHGDSIEAMRGRLNAMKQEYYALSKSQRENAEIGGKLQASIKALNDDISAAEQSVGDFRRNVGNYENAINSAIGANKGIIGQLVAMQAQAKATGKTFSTVLVGGIKAVGAAFKALLANPIVLVLAGVVAIITSLTRVMKGNEEQTRRLNKIFAPLRRSFEAAKAEAQAFADVLISVMEWIGKVTGGIAKALEKLPFVGKYIQQANDANREAIQLEKDKQALQDATSQNTLEQAKTEERVSDLRAKIMQKDKYSAEERLKMSNEAADLEKEQTDKEIALAEERLRIAKIEASYKKNSAETNEELIRLEEEVIRTRTAGMEKLRSLEEKRQGAIAEIANEQKKADEERLKREQEYQKTVDDGRKRIYDLTLDLMADGQDKELALRKKQYEEDLKGIHGTESQKAQIRKLLEEQYERDTQAIREKYSQEALDKAISAKEKELAIMLELAGKDAEAQYNIKVQQLEMEREAAIREAEETGVSVALVEQQYAQKRQEMDEELETARSEARATRLSEYLNGISEQYSAELEMYAENERAKADIELQAEQEKMNALLTLTDEHKAAMFDSEEAYQEAVREQIRLTDEAQKRSTDEAKKASVAAVQDAQAKMDSLSQISGGLTDMFNQIAGDNEQMQGFLKAIALFQIGVDMAKAIAGAIAGAMTQPFPANIAAVVSGIAAVTAGIVQAKQTLSKQKETTAPKFAAGGLVSGAGTGTSDSVPAMLSNGESVINARSTSMFAPLLSSINQAGGGIPIQMQNTAVQTMSDDYIAESIARAMERMPNPVVSVAEINTVNSRVSVNEALRSR